MPTAAPTLPTLPRRAAAQLGAKERWLAALRLQPVDRLPFWPKLDAAYLAARATPLDRQDLPALHRWIGSDEQVWVGQGLRAVRACTEVRVEREGDVQRTIWRAACGQIERLDHYDAASRSWHPQRFPVRSVEDIRVLAACYEDLRIELDEAALVEVRARVEELGGRALAATSIGTSPLMEFIQWQAGVADAHFLLADHPDAVEELFAVQQRCLCRKAELLAARSPADALYLTENTSTTLISPAQYRRYCKPFIRDCGHITRAAGKPLILHMCGHLKALLADLGELPVEAFEAFTSPTVGNTTLLDGRTQCPDKGLVGGTNAALWLEPAEAIIAQLERDLDALPHHRGLVLTSAGVMPPACAPETIRAVCRWVQAYPAGM